MWVDLFELDRPGQWELRAHGPGVWTLYAGEGSEGIQTGILSRVSAIWIQQPHISVNSGSWAENTLPTFDFLGIPSEKWNCKLNFVELKQNVAIFSKSLSFIYSPIQTQSASCEAPNTESHR